MAATITGIVFNDLNNNGQFDPGEPGIPNVFLTLYNASTMTCAETVTDPNGNYSFSVTAAGTYTVYETVSSAAACPPTVFTQPDGFFLSNGPRKRTSTITTAQINNGAVIANQNFGHSAVDAPLPCTTTMVQFVNTPTEWYNINVVTGVATFEGLLIPAHNVNAIGFNVLDNFIYGYDQTTHQIVRIDDDRVLTQLFPNPPGLPASDFNTGAFDLSGHLFLFVNNTNRFYTVDLNQSSPTYLKLVNPATGYTEQTSNFGTALSTTLNVSDWAFNPNDGFLYGVTSVGSSAQVMRVNPVTGGVTALTTTLPVLSPTGRSWGAVAMDATGALFAIYNGDGGVFRFTISGTTAVGMRISTTFTTSFNDATMCPTALIGPIADIGVVKFAAPSPVAAGEQLTYTMIVTNHGPDSADDVTLVDAIPPKVLSPEYSLDGGINFFPWTGNLDLGTFASGALQTVLIRGIVSSGAAGSISNTAVVGSSAEDPNPDNNESTVDVPVAESADMAIIKTALPTPVTAGEQILFTLEVTNLGPSDAQNVVVTDIIPPQVLSPQYSLNGGITFFPWTGSVDLGTFANGETRNVLIRGTVAPSATGSISNTATVESTTPDPNPENNTSTVVDPIEASADMAIQKTASPNPVQPGELLTFHLNVSNLGPSDAQNVTVTDAVPAAVLSPQFSLDGGITFFPWTGMLVLGTFAAGTAQTILIRGTVSPTATGIIANTAVVSSPTPDPDPTNNSSTVDVPVSAQSADMAIQKTASPNPVQPGELLTFTLDVTNFGPDSAQDVTVTDAVPAAVLSPEYSLDGGATFFPWTGSLNLGDFALNQTQTILIRGTVSPAAAGVIVNTATVSSTTPDPDPTNNTDTVTVFVGEAADMAIVKTASPSPARPGQLLTYALTVANAGPSDAQNVVVSDVVPPQLLAPQYSLDGVTFFPWTGSIDLGTFAAGQFEVVYIRGTLDPEAVGFIVNTAVVSSTTPDPNPDNNTSTNITAICDARCQAVTDLIQSVALQQTGLSHILNAEGEKLQKIIGTPGVTTDMLLGANRSARALVSSIARLESLLSGKLAMFEDCLCSQFPSCGD